MPLVHTCVEILRHIESNYSNPTALNWRDQDHWHSISTKFFLDSVKELALGLYDMGMQRGDHIGILANSSPFWTIADLAIMIAGGVVVPLFASISEDNFVYEVSHTDIKLLFLGGEEQWALFDRHQVRFNRIIGIGNCPSHPKVTSIEVLMERGRSLNEKQPDLYQQLLDKIHPNDLAMVIYTSGSTGSPKGVELTQENISCLLGNDPYIWSTFEDRYLSVLPLEHIFGHSVNLWLLFWGVSIYYSQDYKNLSKICDEVKPTAIVVVPRLLEKVYEKICELVHTSTGFKHRLGLLGLKMTNRRDPNVVDRLLHPLIDNLVYSKFRQALGGNLRVVISGGASLDPHLNSFFEKIGVPIYEGWGMTEACPICVNVPGHLKIGTVGIPLEGYQLKIVDGGEILVRGPAVMKGYYKDPEGTSKMIDTDGWMHTGDRGKIDEKGALTILGRVKEMYKTSTGEYVAPVPIEQALCRDPLIESAMVIAEGRKFTSCLLFPSEAVINRLKIKYSSEALSDEEFLKGPVVLNEMQRLLGEVNRHLNHWEQIRAYRFVLKPLSVKDGELTPSMKMRREVIGKKYRELIDEMYRV